VIQPLPLGSLFPCLTALLVKKILPNIQSKPSLVQLETIYCCPITCFLGKETDTHLAAASFWVVVESNKVPPQSLFLQTKQPQFSQPLLTRFGSLDPSPALLLFFRCTPAPHCPSCREGLKIEHSIRGAASPVPSTAARSLSCSCWPHYS